MNRFLGKIAESLEIKLSELFELNEKGSLNVITFSNDNKSKVYIGSSASELEKQLAINGLQVKELAMKDRETENLREIIALLKREPTQSQPI